MSKDNEPAGRDVFLMGKIVSLCVPNITLDILNGSWHTWFNDIYITKFTEHGVRPITEKEEADIIQDELQNPNSLILTIVSNIDSRLIGVISLKNINHRLRRAEIALVTDRNGVPGAALEAMSLMTEHGFDRLNLQKIYAGQHEGLWKWVNTLALIGYKIEGLRRDDGYRSGQSYDVVLTGITATDFYRIRANRGGSLVNKDAVALSKQRATINLIPDLKKLLEDINNKFIGGEY